MDLTQEERKRIYEEELAKEREKKLNSLTEEERRRIFEEESLTKTVYLNDSMIIGPSITGWKAWILWFVLWFGLLLIFRSVAGFIISLIVLFIIALVLTIRDPVVFFPTIHFNCPYCNNKMYLRLDRNPKERSYIGKNQTESVKCPKCKRELVIDYKYAKKYDGKVV